MVAIRSIKGFLFVLILAVTSMIFTPLFLGPTLILLWLKPRWFRFINDSLVTVWLGLPVVMLEYMLDVKIILTGEKPARYENSIIIMNHRCRLDWMFFWCVMARSSELALRNEKILMKRELKYIPGPGWAMQNALYIFLYRRWEKDESYLNSLLRYFVSSPDKLHLLMFPEGTNFEEITKTWSDNYAKKNDLPLYDYVLHPRVRGFTHCVEKLRQEMMFGVKIVVTGDKPPKSENSVIIMNHRCRLDWMFFWSFVARYGELKHEKIIMKRELKHIPGPGWAMQNALYIFLHRRWERDESYLNSVLSYFVNSSDSLQLLLFPEGTNFEEASKQKSDSFATKNNLPFYDYVLHPRVRGFTYCVEKLRQGNLDAILDVTVGYSENYCFEEVDLLKGNVPSEIHFHIQRYSNDALPQDTQGLEEWCCKQWMQKEDRLRKFYTKEKYFGPPSEIASEQQNEIQLAVSYLFKKGLIFWLLFTICLSVLLYMSAMVRWYVLIIGIVYLTLSCFGGTDEIFLQLIQKSMDTKTK